MTDFFFIQTFAYRKYILVQHILFLANLAENEEMLK